MIQFIRDKTTSIVTKIFLVLLALSFSLWGAEGFVRRFTGDPVVLTVGEHDARLQQVSVAYKRTLDAIRRQSGAELNPMLRRVVMEQTLAQLTQELAAAQLAEDLQVPVARATLRREIAATPIFQNEAGQFDPVQFQTALRQIGLSEADLLERLATEHAVRGLWQAVLEGVPTPAPLVAAVAQQATEQRQIAFVTVPVTPEAVAVTEDALKTYHTNNTRAFMTPEQRTVDLVRIDPAGLAKTLKVTEADVVAYYESHTAQFSVPEQRRVAQLVLSSRAEADRALALVQDGRTLAEIPAQLKEARFVDLGMVKRENLLKELVEPAFGAAKGKVAGPVESALGWHLIAVNDITPGATNTLDAVRAEIEKTLADSRAYDQAVSAVNAIEDAIFNGEPLRQAAEEQGLKVETLQNLTLAAQAGDPALLSDTPKLRQDIFKAVLNEPAAFTELADGSMVTFAVTGIVPPREQTFAEARPAIETAYRAEQARATASKRADDIAAAVGTGTAFDAAAKELKIKLTAFAGRAETVADLPASALDKAFAAPVGQPITDATESGEIVAVSVAARQRPGLTATDTEQATAAAKQAVSESLRGEFNAALEAALQQRYPVKRNEKALARLLAE
jgi:peptidyl-prolyl cis-trans isomerase D